VATLVLSIWSWVVLGAAGLLLGGLGLLSGCSQVVLGCSWVAFGCSWVAIGCSWGALGAFLGCSLGASGRLLDAFRCVFFGVRFQMSLLMLFESCLNHAKALKSYACRVKRVCADFGSVSLSFL
jgi:hypothetical protein